MSARSPRSALLALIDYGDQLRRDRRRRRRIARRAGVIAALITLTGTTIVAPPAPRFVWNASASMPLGLYAVTPGALPAKGDTVIAWAPEPWRRLAAVRHYLPGYVPLVKRVAAVPGDRICAEGAAVFVDDVRIATRATRDGQGRTLPWWSGCRILHDGDYLLLIPGVAASFDGRYFGATNRTQIVGTARLIWRQTARGGGHD